MTDETKTDYDFIIEVLRVVSDNDDTSAIWWRCDGEWAPVTFFVNCNDLFFWGSADTETITPGNIGELVRAYADAEAIDKCAYASQLFCARVRKMRPQGACYPEPIFADRRDEPETLKLWALYDACGPERETGFGNPYRPGEYKPKR